MGEKVTARAWCADHKLIVSAVDACFSVSPDNPQAIAEAIPEAFRLLKVISDGHERTACAISDSDLDNEQPRNGATLGDFRKARALLHCLSIKEQGK